MEVPRPAQQDLFEYCRTHDTYPAQAMKEKQMAIDEVMARYNKAREGGYDPYEIQRLSDHAENLLYEYNCYEEQFGEFFKMQKTLKERESNDPAVQKVVHNRMHYASSLERPEKIDYKQSSVALAPSAGSGGNKLYTDHIKGQKEFQQEQMQENIQQQLALRDQVRMEKQEIKHHNEHVQQIRDHNRQVMNEHHRQKKAQQKEHKELQKKASKEEEQVLKDADLQEKLLAQQEIQEAKMREQAGELKKQWHNERQNNADLRRMRQSVIKQKQAMSQDEWLQMQQAQITQGRVSSGLHEMQAKNKKLQKELQEQREQIESQEQTQNLSKTQLAKRRELVQKQQEQCQELQHMDNDIDRHWMHQEQKMSLSTRNQPPPQSDECQPSQAEIEQEIQRQHEKAMEERLEQQKMQEMSNIAPKRRQHLNDDPQQPNMAPNNQPPPQYNQYQPPQTGFEQEMKRLHEKEMEQRLEEQKIQEMARIAPQRRQHFNEQMTPNSQYQEPPQNELYQSYQSEKQQKKQKRREKKMERMLEEQKIQEMARIVPHIRQHSNEEMGLNSNNQPPAQDTQYQPPLTAKQQGFYEKAMEKRLEEQKVQEMAQISHQMRQSFNEAPPQQQQEQPQQWWQQQKKPKKNKNKKKKGKKVKDHQQLPEKELPQLKLPRHLELEQQQIQEAAMQQNQPMSFEAPAYGQQVPYPQQLQHEQAMAYEEQMRHQKAMAYEEQMQHQQLMAYEEQMQNQQAMAYEEQMQNQQAMAYEEQMQNQQAMAYEEQMQHQQAMAYEEQMQHQQAMAYEEQMQYKQAMTSEHMEHHNHIPYEEEPFDNPMPYQQMMQHHPMSYQDDRPFMKPMTYDEELQQELEYAEQMRYEHELLEQKAYEEWLQKEEELTAEQKGKELEERLKKINAVLNVPEEKVYKNMEEEIAAVEAENKRLTEAHRLLFEDSDNDSNMSFNREVKKVEVKKVLDVPDGNTHKNLEEERTAVGAANKQQTEANRNLFEDSDKDSNFSSNSTLNDDPLPKPIVEVKKGLDMPEDKVSENLEEERAAVEAENKRLTEARRRLFEDSDDDCKFSFNSDSDDGPPPKPIVEKAKFESCISKVDALRAKFQSCFSKTETLKAKIMGASKVDPDLLSSDESAPDDASDERMTRRAEDMDADFDESASSISELAEDVPEIPEDENEAVAPAKETSMKTEINSCPMADFQITSEPCNQRRHREDMDADIAVSESSIDGEADIPREEGRTLKAKFEDFMRVSEIRQQARHLENMDSDFADSESSISEAEDIAPEENTKVIEIEESSRPIVDFKLAAEPQQYGHPDNMDADFDESENSVIEVIDITPEEGSAIKAEIEDSPRPMVDLKLVVEPQQKRRCPDNMDADFDESEKSMSEVIVKPEEGSAIKAEIEDSPRPMVDFNLVAEPQQMRRHPDNMDADFDESEKSMSEVEDIAPEEGSAIKAEIEDSPCPMVDFKLAAEPQQMTRHANNMDADIKGSESCIEEDVKVTSELPENAKIKVTKLEDPKKIFQSHPMIRLLDGKGSDTDESLFADDSDSDTGPLVEPTKTVKPEKDSPLKAKNSEEEFFKNFITEEELLEKTANAANVAKLMLAEQADNIDECTITQQSCEDELEEGKMDTSKSHDNDNLQNPLIEEGEVAEVEQENKSEFEETKDESKEVQQTSTMVPKDEKCTFITEPTKVESPGESTSKKDSEVINSLKFENEMSLPKTTVKLAEMASINTTRVDKSAVISKSSEVEVQAYTMGEIFNDSSIAEDSDTEEDPKVEYQNTMKAESNTTLCEETDFYTSLLKNATKPAIALQGELVDCAKTENVVSINGEVQMQIKQTEIVKPTVKESNLVIAKPSEVEVQEHIVDDMLDNLSIANETEPEENPKVGGAQPPVEKHIAADSEGDVFRQKLNVAKLDDEVDLIKEQLKNLDRENVQKLVAEVPPIAADSEIHVFPQKLNNDNIKQLAYKVEESKFVTENETYISGEDSTKAEADSTLKSKCDEPSYITPQSELDVFSQDFEKAEEAKTLNSKDEEQSIAANSGVNTNPQKLNKGMGNDVDLPKEDLAKPVEAKLMQLQGKEPFILSYAEAHILPQKLNITNVAEIELPGEDLDKSQEEKSMKLTDEDASTTANSEVDIFPQKLNIAMVDAVDLEEKDLKKPHKAKQMKLTYEEPSIVTDSKVDIFSQKLAVIAEVDLSKEDWKTDEAKQMKLKGQGPFISADVEADNLLKTPMTLIDGELSIAVDSEVDIFPQLNIAKDNEIDIPEEDLTKLDRAKLMKLTGKEPPVSVDSECDVFPQKLNNARVEEVDLSKADFKKSDEEKLIKVTDEDSSIIADSDVDIFPQKANVVKVDDEVELLKQDMKKLQEACKARKSKSVAKPYEEESEQDVIDINFCRALLHQEEVDVWPKAQRGHFLIPAMQEDSEVDREENCVDEEGSLIDEDTDSLSEYSIGEIEDAVVVHFETKPEDIPEDLIQDGSKSENVTVPGPKGAMRGDFDALSVDDDSECLPDNYLRSECVGSLVDRKGDIGTSEHVNIEVEKHAPPKAAQSICKGDPTEEDQQVEREDDSDISQSKDDSESTSGIGAYYSKEELDAFIREEIAKLARTKRADAELAMSKMREFNASLREEVFRYKQLHPKQERMEPRGKKMWLWYLPFPPEEPRELRPHRETHPNIKVPQTEAMDLFSPTDHFLETNPTVVEPGIIKSNQQTMKVPACSSSAPVNILDFPEIAASESVPRKSDLVSPKRVQPNPTDANSGEKMMEEASKKKFFETKPALLSRKEDPLATNVVREVIETVEEVSYQSEKEDSLKEDLCVKKKPSLVSPKEARLKAVTISEVVNPKNKDSTIASSSELNQSEEEYPPEIKLCVTKKPSLISPNEAPPKAVAVYEVSHPEKKGCNEEVFFMESTSELDQFEKGATKKDLCIPPKEAPPQAAGIHKLVEPEKNITKEDPMRSPSRSALVSPIDNLPMVVVSGVVKPEAGVKDLPVHIPIDPPLVPPKEALVSTAVVPKVVEAEGKAPKKGLLQSLPSMTKFKPLPKLNFFTGKVESEPPTQKIANKAPLKKQSEAVTCISELIEEEPKQLDRIKTLLENTPTTRDTTNKAALKMQADAVARISKLMGEEPKEPKEDRLKTLLENTPTTRDTANKAALKMQADAVARISKLMGEEPKQPKEDRVKTLLENTPTSRDTTNKAALKMQADAVARISKLMEEEPKNGHVKTLPENTPNTRDLIEKVELKRQADALKMQADAVARISKLMAKEPKESEVDRVKTLLENTPTTRNMTNKAALKMQADAVARISKLMADEPKDPAESMQEEPKVDRVKALLENTPTTKNKIALKPLSKRLPKPAFTSSMIEPKTTELPQEDRIRSLLESTPRVPSLSPLKRNVLSSVGSETRRPGVPTDHQAMGPLRVSSAKSSQSKLPKAPTTAVSQPSSPALGQKMSRFGPLAPI